MFPGYLFVITGQPKELYWRLKSIPQFTKLLRTENEVFLDDTLRQEAEKPLEKMLQLG